MSAIFQIENPLPETLAILRTLIQKVQVAEFVDPDGTEEEAHDMLGRALRLFPPFWHEIKPKVYQKKQKAKRGRKPMRRQLSHDSTSTDASSGEVEPVAVEDIAARPAVVTEVDVDANVDTAVKPDTSVQADLLVHRRGDGNVPRPRLRKKQALATSEAVTGPSRRRDDQAGWDAILPAPPSPPRARPRPRRDDHQTGWDSIPPETDSSLSSVVGTYELPEY
ncbi:hypothetical protein PPYR_02385 [Photinus pyralis]|uniref:Uncharacterized protein n=1 Tax=Photinus pyralis TaxID=7054 RepID=A0A5N4B736_PHOPY|nr:hypothetical protein PPYR_02385 [Photinus pyralis]